MRCALAVVVEGEQLAERPEARRLGVQAARLDAEAHDVVHGVDGRVPGDAVVAQHEHRGGLRVGEVGILEPGVRERVGAGGVDLGVGLHVDRRALVGALEVDDVDGARWRPAR